MKNSIISFTPSYQNYLWGKLPQDSLVCRYLDKQEILEDTDAGFLLNQDEPIYFWVLKDEKTKAWFIAKILIENTPFGKLQAVTTKIEVKP